MDRFKIYSKTDLSSLVNIREGEVKVGEQVQLTESLERLSQCSARFVLLGIPEDIGVRANHGIGGTGSAWLPSLRALLNMQSNAFLSGSEILLLGAFEIEEPEGQSPEHLRQKVQEIDALVYPLIEKIVAAGKIPIVIGGGHNNAYGLIRGTYAALQLPVNVVNIDAHTDLRPAEGRHSGNGFRYALEEGYLKHYHIFGLAENYVHAPLLEELNKDGAMRAFYFRDLLRSEKPVVQHWQEFIAHIPQPFGLEIDLDSIGGVLSSAVTPSGFTVNEIRAILLSGTKKCSYLHLCEGAVRLADGREDLSTGKTIAFLISDFIAVFRAE
ncbi:Formimidoylglutamase [compost metagenome]